MCEFPDSDGVRILRPLNASNVVLDAVSNFRYGELLGECLSDIELGRLALICHFALDCLCDLWRMTVEVDGYLSDGMAGMMCLLRNGEHHLALNSHGGCRLKWHLRVTLVLVLDAL